MTQKYGDKKVIAEHYDSMEKYFSYLAKQGLHGPLERYGDWLAYEDTPKPYISLCYYAGDVDLMIRYAEILGKSDRAAHFSALRGEIQAEFDRNYVKDGSLTLSSQTALPRCGIAPLSKRDRRA